MHSKSQIHAQIFVYIIAIILFSFILVYGYNAIRGFKERSEQIVYIKFKTDLTSTISRISSDYGTLKREEFFIGGEYKKVCFVQSYNPPVNLTEKVTDLIVRDSVRDNIGKNVFLFAGSLGESFDVGKINVSNGYLCIPVINGKAKIQFEGKGNHALISKWSD